MLEEGVNISDLVVPQLSLVMVCSETDGLQVRKEAVISKLHSPLPSGLLRLWNFSPEMGLSHRFDKEI